MKIIQKHQAEKQKVCSHVHPKNTLTSINKGFDMKHTHTHIENTHVDSCRQLAPLKQTQTNTHTHAHTTAGTHIQNLNNNE